MENLEILTDNQFYIDKISKLKLIRYTSFRYNQKHKGYEFYNKHEELKLGVQLCDFINTDFSSYEGMKKFVEQYSICTIAELGNIPIYRFYKDFDYNDLINKLIDKTAKKLSKIQKALIKDIEYIYNLNELEELSNISPAQRLYILRKRKQKAKVFEIYEESKINLCLNNLGDFTKFSITNEEDAQEIAKVVKNEDLLPYNYLCKNIIPTFVIELLELTTIENIEIKRCKNCGKFFVPENRSDELYCSNIFENGKTCKEVGPFKVKQKLMEENNDLKVYRNVYQKLLLRTRRNPMNDEYEKDFIEFKKKNAELKEKISNGKLTQEEYMKWLNEL